MRQTEVRLGHSRRPSNSDEKAQDLSTFLLSQVLTPKASGKSSWLTYSQHQTRIESRPALVHVKGKRKKTRKKTDQDTPPRETTSETPPRVADAKELKIAETERSETQEEIG